MVKITGLLPAILPNEPPALAVIIVILKGSSPITITSLPLPVWMASAARSVPGKILAVFFPILAFVVAGFEHSIANMYYLAAGLFTAAQTGAAAGGLTWGRALLGNLLPVTLGNLVGGVLLAGMSAWYLYLKQGKANVNS